jgi:hypothetical protein
MLSFPFLFFLLSVPLILELLDTNGGSAGCSHVP